MRVAITRYGIEIRTESQHDLAFIEDTLGIKCDRVGIVIPHETDRDGKAIGLLIDIKAAYPPVPRDAVDALPGLWADHLEAAQIDDEGDEDDDQQEPVVERTRTTDLRLLDLDLSQIPKASMAKAFFTRERGDMTADDVVRALGVAGYHIDRNAVATTLAKESGLFERVSRGVYRRIEAKAKPSPEPTGAVVVGQASVPVDWTPPKLPGDVSLADAEVSSATETGIEGLKEPEVVKLARMCLRAHDHIVTTKVIKDHLKAKGHPFSVGSISSMLAKADWAKEIAEGHWKLDPDWEPNGDA